MSLNRMVTTSLLLSLAALAGACGDDDPSQTGGNGGGEEGGGGEGGGPPATEQELEGEISSITLTSDTLWILKGVVSVPAGETLTIEPGTTIVGDKASLGTLVVQRGGKLDARGTAEAPIVFTSALPVGEREEGDWGGVVILGKAPINEAGGEAEVEGFQEPQLYGGTDADDDSGTLEHVRIEFGGIEISDGNEINGLTLAGVGRGTTIDFVQVKNTLDDCFEFFGGTVNAKYLACQYPTDDGIDWDNGYSGKIQFAVVQQNPNANEDCNGFEGDNDATGTANAPISHPVIYNATLCGQNFDQSKVQYGMLIRKRSAATLRNILVSGFETGWDVRNTVDPLVNPILLQGSVFFGNLANLIAENEPVGSPQDDDAGFDEIAELNKPENGNSTADPMLGNCFDPNAPGFGPATSLTTGAVTPPNDGFFDVTASYTGAFKDATDDWAMKGNWPVWSAQ